MIINIILGKAGSGKGTASSRYIHDHPDVNYIESGSLIRNKLVSNTEIQSLINNGNLIPTETICDMIIEAIDDRITIIDGFPRTLEQLLILRRRLPNAKINAILLDCSSDICLNRLLNRNRSDDHPDAIKRRFDIYDHNISELMSALPDIRIIDASVDADQVYRQFESLIE